uniref:EGF-like domain-containing protein n=1 Tax=Branchiostoma floridae TaxID=7739 RepID=C3ZFC0_BRAFL|eukprot:XP_002593415.1 hypothetical protein BRAFLDRAFT_70805 [Branchiostoma floridae]
MGNIGIGIVVVQEAEPPGETNSCKPNNGGCSHLCLLSPDPPNYRCACPTGIRLQEDGRTCADGWNPCAENNGGCSHLCLYRPTGVSCDCPTDMELLNTDGRTCIVPEAFLLVLRSSDIRRVSLETQNNKDKVLPMPDMKVASSFDLDISDNRIYWADVNLNVGLYGC